MSLYKIGMKKELMQLLGSVQKFRLYGAGHYLHLFLNEVSRIDNGIFEKIACIVVGNMWGNPRHVAGIPIISCKEAKIQPGDLILLTLGHRYTEEAYELLKVTGAQVVQIDFNMFQKDVYQKVYRSIQPLLITFPKKITGLNQPRQEEPVRAWTCWWQGERMAPEIVKACLESQRRNLPTGVEQIIITEENYKTYIDLPEHIIRKVKNGSITLTTLSDIIRSSLLYRYGGFWMDATLFCVRPLESSILKYDFYTRNLPETQYCADAMWAGWFMYSKPGDIMFLFLMESFFFYFLKHDTLQQYFMIDYLIAIACNTFQEVEDRINRVPFNNERALELGRHLAENYDEEKFEEYVRDTSVQKLTYKNSGIKEEGTVYQYITEHWGKKNA